MKQESENATGASASVREVEWGRHALVYRRCLIGLADRTARGQTRATTDFQTDSTANGQGKSTQPARLPDCGAGRVGGTGRTR